MEISEAKIKTNAEYNQTMNSIEMLLDCPAGSKEAERLETLSILLDEYEKEHFPI